MKTTKTHSQKEYQWLPASSPCHSILFSWLEDFSSSEIKPRKWLIPIVRFTRIASLGSRKRSWSFTFPWKVPQWNPFRCKFILKHKKQKAKKKVLLREHKRHTTCTAHPSWSYVVLSWLGGGGGGVGWVTLSQSGGCTPILARVVRPVLV